MINKANETIEMIERCAKHQPSVFTDDGYRWWNPTGSPEKGAWIGGIPADPGEYTIWSVGNYDDASETWTYKPLMSVKVEWSLLTGII